MIRLQIVPERAWPFGVLSGQAAARQGSTPSSWSTTRPPPRVPFPVGLPLGQRCGAEPTTPPREPTAGRPCRRRHRPRPSGPPRRRTLGPPLGAVPVVGASRPAAPAACWTFNASVVGRGGKSRRPGRWPGKPTLPRPPGAPTRDHPRIVVMVNGQDVELDPAALVG